MASTKEYLDFVLGQIICDFVDNSEQLTDFIKKQPINKNSTEKWYEIEEYSDCC